MAGSDPHITVLTLNVNAKCPNQKTQTGKLNKKSAPIDVLYSGNPSHIQRHTQTENKGLEEDLLSKWRTKKSRGCNPRL